MISPVRRSTWRPKCSRDRQRHSRATSTASASCCTTWSPASIPSRAERSTRSSRPTCAAAESRSPSGGRICRTTSFGSSIAPPRRIRTRGTRRRRCSCTTWSRSTPQGARAALPPRTVTQRVVARRSLGWHRGNRHHAARLRHIDGLQRRAGACCRWPAKRREHGSSGAFARCLAPIFNARPDAVRHRRHSRAIWKTLRRFVRALRSVRRPARGAAAIAGPPARTVERRLLRPDRLHLRVGNLRHHRAVAL